MHDTTAKEIGLKSYEYNSVKPHFQFKINDWTILPFELEHDVTNLGYLIQHGEDKLIYITDTYYSKYSFKGLTGMLLECNYCKDTLDANVASGEIDLSMKNRLLKSHLSLENAKKFLQANDLNKCTNIVLIHLSDRNSNADRIQREVQELTQVDTVIADKGMEFELGCGF